MSEAKVRWSWTGVANLDYSRDDSELRTVVANLPRKTSHEDVIVTYLVDLRAHFQRWLHQDEFGPSCKEKAAALRVLVKSFEKLQKQLDKIPPALWTRLDKALRDGADPSTTIMQAIYEAAADLECELRTAGVPNEQVQRASQLKQCIATLDAQLQSLDTNTDDNIFEIALARRFDRSQAAGDLGMKEIASWLNGYWNVVVATLDKLSDRRGADERVSLKLLVYQLCELWERETGYRVTAHEPFADEYTPRAETPAGRFVTAAVEAMLPDELWFEEHTQSADLSRAQTFLPGWEVDRARQVLVIMNDFVVRRHAD